MVRNQLSWMIGGPQGSGVDSSANTFARSVASAGLHIYGNREYHSNIKGDHSYFMVRVAEKEIYSHSNDVHLLATFDLETLQTHREEVVSGGAIIYDPETTPAPELTRKDVLWVPVPYVAIIAETAKQFGKADLSKLMIMKNVISVAASFGLLEFDLEFLAKTLEWIFRGKKAALVPMNLAAGKKAYGMMADQFAKKFDYKLSQIPVPAGERRILINGTTATAIGKILGGCKFQTYYPITPASDESEYLESHPEFGTVVVQSEDEIAAILSAIGASLVGARASTSTSGPGFCLMAEGLGWAAMNEVPVVVFNYQRAGPSTGLPTRHEQGDLKFALTIGHGDFPRIVVCPGNLEEYFYYAAESFNWADRYQMPVIVMNDKAVANSTKTVRWYDTSSISIDRGLLLDDAQLAKYLASQSNGGYKRFRFTENGLSPRSVPGMRGGVFWNTGDEHDEKGHISEEPNNRIKMMDKRMNKLLLAEREIPLDQKVKVFGPEKADVTFVTWGSTKGPILDALEELKAVGISANCLQIILAIPFPTAYVEQFLSKAKKKVAVEMNYDGQMANVIRERTGIAMDHKILKWNGRPITKDEVLWGLRKITREKCGKVVLTHGL